MIKTLLTAVALVLTVGQASADIRVGPGTVLPDGYFSADEKAKQIMRRLPPCHREGS
jgi:hypothetical protein